MKKKNSMVFGIALVSISGYLYFSDEIPMIEKTITDENSSFFDSEQSKEARSESGFNNTSVESNSFDESGETHVLSSAELQVMESKAAVIKKDIDSLILKFDANLLDPETRNEVKHKINAKIAEYNEMTLPVAMAEMKRRTQE